MSRRKPFRPAVIAAAGLSDGRPLWRRADGSWSTDFNAAELLTDARRAADALAAAEADTGRVVGPYLAEAEAGPDGRPRPAHFRERFRVSGPTAPLPGRGRAAAPAKWGE